MPQKSTTSGSFMPSRKTRDSLLTNLALIFITLVALVPIGTTVLISFKREQDVTRKPPVIFPCDTPTSSFDLTACRWSIEGYERVIQATPSKDALLGVVLKGRMLSTYLPNTVLYAVGTALIVMILAALAGYGFSRYHFRGHDALMVGIFAITGVPLLTNLLALYQMGVVTAQAADPHLQRPGLHHGRLHRFLPADQHLDRQRLLRRDPARAGRGRADRRLQPGRRARAHRHAADDAWPDRDLPADLRGRVERVSSRAIC